MKMTYVRVVSAFFALAALAAASRAQETDQVTVNIPYEFVAAGKTLPAGNYTVKRANANDLDELIITSFENHAGAFLLSSVVSATREDKPTLRFEVVGGQHFLSQIETANHIFTIPVSAKAEPVVAKNQTSPATSGGRGQR